MRRSRCQLTWPSARALSQKHVQEIMKCCHHHTENCTVTCKQSKYMKAQLRLGLCLVHVWFLLHTCGMWRQQDAGCRLPAAYCQQSTSWETNPKFWQRLAAPSLSVSLSPAVVPRHWAILLQTCHQNVWHSWRPRRARRRRRASFCLLLFK